MSDPQLFEEACELNNVEGRRFDIENYPDSPTFPLFARTRDIATELVSSAHQHLPHLPPIHFDFVETPQVNAWAFKYNNEYFIAVTAGAVIMLHLVLGRILASPNALLWIGDPSQEKDDEQPVPWDVIDPQRWHELGIRPVAPRNEHRNRYACRVRNQVLNFLVGHEIAHVTRGHVDYLLASTGSSFLAELGWRGSSQQRIQRQTIERDADFRSVYARCYSMFLTEVPLVGQILPWTGRPATITDFQFDWAFGVNVLFRLFGDKQFSKMDLESDSYPPLPLRRRMAMDFGYHLLLDRYGPKNTVSIQNAVSGGVEMADQAFTAIKAGPAEGGLSDAYSNEGSAHIAKLDDCWKLIKPALAKYAYESLDLW